MHHNYYTSWIYWNSVCQTSSPRNCYKRYHVPSTVCFINRVYKWWLNAFHVLGTMLNSVSYQIWPVVSSSLHLVKEKQKNKTKKTNPEKPKDYDRQYDKEIRIYENKSENTWLCLERGQGKLHNQTKVRNYDRMKGLIVKLLGIQNQLDLVSNLMLICRKERSLHLFVISGLVKMCMSERQRDNTFLDEQIDGELMN